MISHIPAYLFPHVMIQDGLSCDGESTLGKGKSFGGVAELMGPMHTHAARGKIAS